MSDKAKWVLPEVVDPSERYCFQIQVPKDPYHLAAFRGAILALASGYNWQDDTAHTARQVALVWREIYYAIKTCDGSENPLRDYSEDIDMGIRIDCDCQAFIPCCDGTEKQLVTTDMLGKPGQPGSGSPQPQPGHSSCYEGTLFAGGFFLVPTIVNAGDVITIQSVQGASSDNGIDWYCPDGSTFFAGTCSGSGTTSGSDVAPSLKHMQVIALIDGTYYSAKSGDVITVPGGVVNKTVTLRVNCPTSPSGNSGNLQVSVCVANNQAVTWSHTLDLLSSSHGFLFRHSGVSPFDQQGQWVAAAGLQTTLVTGPTEYDRYLDAYLPFASITTLTRVQITYDETVGANGLGCSLVNIVQYLDSGGSPHNLSTQSAANGSGQIINWTGSQAAKGLELVGWAGCQNNPTDPGGSVTIYQLIVSGTGFDPFV